MRKWLIFILLLLVASAAGGYIYSQHGQISEKFGNPYQKKTADLNPASVKILDDKNYQYNITPKDLDQKIENGENIYVYFYSPTCPFCKKTTPVVNDVFKQNGIKPLQYNLLEFNDGWEKYAILGTPTLIHFNKGKEVSRISGAKDKMIFEQWMKDNKNK